MFIRKFFDIGTPEGTTTSSPSIASLMATHGVMNTTENPIAEPIELDKGEKNQQPPATEQESPVEPTNDTQKEAETVVQESPKPATEEVKVETTAPIVQPQAQQPADWQEVLRQQPDTEVFKALLGNDELADFVSGLKELDPKMVAFFKHWKENDGDVSQYVKEMSTDYSKMPAEEVMRHQLREEYPKASEQQLDILYRKKIVEQYNLDSVNEDEAQEGRLLLEAEADKHRDRLVQKQSEYLLPKPPAPKAAEPAQPDQQAIQAEKEKEAYRKSVTDSSLFKNVIATNKITLGEGEEAFNLPVESKDLTDILFENKLPEHLFIQQEDGSYVPDVEKHLLIAAIAKFGKTFLHKYAEHFKGLGGKAVVDPIENAKPPEGSRASLSEAAPKTAAEAMAKMGTLNPGGRSY